MKNYVHKVNYYECDRMGVTHHSNYIRFMEETRIYAMEQMGYGFERMEAEGVVSPVTAISVNYKKPTTFPDEIEIELKVLEMSNLKMRFGYRMTVRGALVCTAESSHCFLEGGRPVVLEKRFPELYAKFKEIMDAQQ